MTAPAKPTGDSSLADTRLQLWEDPGELCSGRPSQDTWLTGAVRSRKNYCGFAAKC